MLLSVRPINHNRASVNINIFWTMMHKICPSKRKDMPKTKYQKNIKRIMIIIVLVKSCVHVSTLYTKLKRILLLFVSYNSIEMEEIFHPYLSRNKKRGCANCQMPLSSNKKIYRRKF